MLSAKNIDRGSINLENPRFISVQNFEQEDKRTLVRAGVVLLTIVGSIGRSAVVDTELPAITLQRSVAVLTPKISPDFLQWQLSTRTCQSWLADNAVGTAQKGVYLSTLRQLPIVVAPSKEQERIVKELQRISARTRLTMKILDSVPPLLSRLRQSVLQAAFCGRLTADWRSKNPKTEPADKLLEHIYAKRGFSRENQPQGDADLTQIPETWAKSSIGNVFDVHIGATPARGECSYWGGPIPWVSSGEVAFCRISVTREQITELGLANTSTRIHPPGTILLGMIGEGKTRGQAAILDISACNNQNSAAIRVSDSPISPEYVYYFFQHHYEKTRTSASGNSQPALNKSRVEAITIPIAPLAEQAEMVVRLRRQMLSIDSVENHILAAKSQLKTFCDVIATKAFRGELTIQDPSDEPAAVLLARLREQTALHLQSKPRNRTNGRPSPKQTNHKSDDLKAHGTGLTDEGTSFVKPKVEDLARTKHEPPSTQQTLPWTPESINIKILELAPSVQIDLMHNALLGEGSLEREEAIRTAAERLRDAGHAEFIRLRRDGPLFAALDAALTAGLKAQLFDRPHRGQVRAIVKEPMRVPASLWQRALLAALGAGPLDADAAVHATAVWAQTRIGLEFKRLRAGGHIDMAVRKAIAELVASGAVLRDNGRLRRPPT